MENNVHDIKNSEQAQKHHLGLQTEKGAAVQLLFLPSKMERDNSQGPGGTGQEEMGSR